MYNSTGDRPSRVYILTKNDKKGSNNSCRITKMHVETYNTCDTTLLFINDYNIERLSWSCALDIILFILE